MPQAKPESVDAYLAAVEPARRESLAAVRGTVLANLPDGYEETIQYGMIGYVVPLDRYPPGYHCRKGEPLPFAHLAAQKRHLALYLFCIYTDPALRDRFEAAWRASGKKLDMGKGCVRFRSVDDVPLDVVGEAIASVPVDDFIASYERGRGGG